MKELENVYAQAFQTMIAKKAHTLTAMALWNQKIKLIPTVEGGRQKYKIQRAKRPKSVSMPQANNKSGGDGPSKGLGDQYIEQMNATPQYDWETVETTTSTKRQIAIYSEQTDLGQIEADLAGGLFNQVVSEQMDTIMTETDETILTALFVDSAATKVDLPDLSDNAKILEVYDGIVNAQTFNNELVSDAFKHMNDDENNITLIHPYVASRLAKVAGQYFTHHPEMMANGFPIDGRINGKPYVQIANLNTLQTTDATPKTCGWINFDLESLAVANPMGVTRQIQPQLVGDKYWFGKTYHQLVKVVDGTRITIGVFTPAATQKKTKKVSE